MTEKNAREPARGEPSELEMMLNDQFRVDNGINRVLELFRAQVRERTVMIPQPYADKAIQYYNGKGDLEAKAAASESKERPEETIMLYVQAKKPDSAVASERAAAYVKSLNIDEIKATKLLMPFFTPLIDSLNYGAVARLACQAGFEELASRYEKLSKMNAENGK